MAKILVVEDSRTMRSVIEATLTQAGHDVVTVESGAEGFQCLATEFFDAVITDLHMPSMGGIEFITQMRLVPSCRAVPVLLLTHEDDDYLLAKAQAAGASALLPKPFAEPELIWALERFAIA